MKNEPTTQAETRPVGSVPVNNETRPEQPMLPGMVEPKAETRPLGSVSNVADLAAENESLRSQLHMRKATYDIEARLAKAGARSPKLLAEQSQSEFQIGEDGELANAEAVVEHLRKAWPEQFTPDPPPSIDASAGRTVRPTLTREALARMTPHEIQRLDWNEVRSALQEK